MATSARSSRVLLGLGLLAVGVLFLLENLTDWVIPWQGWWPAILIVIGIWNIVRNRAWFGGFVLTVLGVFFLLDTQDVWDYTIGDIWRFWPVVLILIGGKMLFGRRKKSTRQTPSPYHDDKSSPDELDVTSVFGEDKRRITDQNFSGGQITCIFGGAKIDFRDAGLAGGASTLDVTAVFGGVRIRVPETWTVEVRTTNILGGVDGDRAQPSPGAVGDRLTITGTCLFGGITVES